MNFFEKLKYRWQINSNWQVFVILVVFGLTGFTALFARRFVFSLLGIGQADPFWLKSVVWLLTIFPIYNAFLLIYAALLGQFEFFWRFFKKMISRFIPGKSTS